MKIGKKNAGEALDHLACVLKAYSGRVVPERAIILSHVINQIRTPTGTQAVKRIINNPGIDPRVCLKGQRLGLEVCARCIEVHYPCLATRQVANIGMINMYGLTPPITHESGKRLSALPMKEHIERVAEGIIAETKSNILRECPCCHNKGLAILGLHVNTSMVKLWFCSEKCRQAARETCYLCSRIFDKDLSDHLRLCPSCRLKYLSRMGLSMANDDCNFRTCPNTIPMNSNVVEKARLKRSLKGIFPEVLSGARTSEDIPFHVLRTRSFIVLNGKLRARKIGRSSQKRRRDNPWLRLKKHLGLSK
jgi:hypothetical protein